MKKFIKIIIWVLIIALLAGICVYLFGNYSKPKTRTIFRTEPVVRGDVTSSISASGTVEPEELVNVGAQINGKIMAFGTDADGNQVDYGSKVKAGMTLAQIDDVLYSAELRESKAKKQQADAAIKTADAQIKEAEANKILATLNWERAQQLYSKKAMSKSEYDNAQAAFISSEAALFSANAAMSQAQAQLAIAEAALVKAERNMDYCVITSPVDGIIIDRRVSIGQTVVSNMSASSIFLIAKDLRKVQVWVSVNEADIGHIKPDMPVEFTVDAYPELLFTGKVRKIRLNATMSQNVVTYIVEVTTDNPDGKLLPYLTANVKFIRFASRDVLTISNAALRFMPPADQLTPEYRKLLDDPSKHIVWVRGEDNKIKPVEITTGLVANGRVELKGDQLKEGDEVIYASVIIENNPDDDDKEAQSPFMPEFNKKIRGSGSAARRARSNQENAK